MAFDAMAEDFVEEHARRAPGKNRRADKRVHHRGPQQCRELLARLVDCRGHHIVGRQLREIFRVPAFGNRQIHTVVSLGARDHHHAIHAAALGHAGAFGGHQVLSDALRRQRHFG